MAWDEWEQAKAEAAERRAAQIQLNRTPGEGVTSSGGGTGQLRSAKAAWARASNDVRGLRGNITRALAKLSDGQQGNDITGVESATAQQELHTSWEQYAKKVSGRCGALAGLMEKAGSDQLKTDQAVKSAFAKLNAKYEETPTVGGDHQPRAR